MGVLRWIGRQAVAAWRYFFPPEKKKPVLTPRQAATAAQEVVVVQQIDVQDEAQQDRFKRYDAEMTRGAKQDQVKPLKETIKDMLLKAHQEREAARQEVLKTGNEFQGAQKIYEEEDQSLKKDLGEKFDKKIEEKFASDKEGLEKYKGGFGNYEWDKLMATATVTMKDHPRYTEICKKQEKAKKEYDEAEQNFAKSLRWAEGMLRSIDSDDMVARAAAGKQVNMGDTSRIHESYINNIIHQIELEQANQPKRSEGLSQHSIAAAVNVDRPQPSSRPEKPPIQPPPVGTSKTTTIQPYSRFA